MSQSFPGRSSDTRRHRRLPISSEAFLTLLRRTDRASVKTVRAVARDISITGVRVSTQQVTQIEFDALLPALPFAELDMELPFSERRILVKAEVRWMRPLANAYGFAVEMGLCWSEDDQDLASRITYAMDLISASSSELRPSAEFKLPGIKLKK
jgi:hypothetical protein